MEDKLKVGCDLSGLPFMLTALFVVLKLTGNIDWSWWWVVSPFLLSVGLAVFLGVIFLLMTVAVLVASR